MENTKFSLNKAYEAPRCSWCHTPGKGLHTLTVCKRIGEESAGEARWVWFNLDCYSKYLDSLAPGGKI